MSANSRYHRLHPDASVRALRAKMVELNDYRPELLAAISDPARNGTEAMAALNKIDAEIDELIEAIGVLEEHWAAKQTLRKGAA